MMSKSIPLSRGLFALVDDEDYDFLMQWKWYAYPKSRTFYAGRILDSALMHRVITSAESGKVVDHRNNNGLDNQRQNLRVCTQAENARNTRPHKNNSSGYKGVTWHKGMGKWQAFITVGKQHIVLGYFVKPEDAALARDEAVKKHQGEFGYLNFPDR
jgi:hypothetical protein